MTCTKFVVLLAGLATLVVLTAPVRGQVPFREPEAQFPSTGKEAPGLQPLDEAVITMMGRHGIPGAALAIARNGKDLGWDIVNQKDRAFTYFKDGSWYGMRGFMKRNPKGVNWVLLFNASMDPDNIDGSVAQHAVREVQQAVERMDKYPNIDLFEE